MKYKRRLKRKNKIDQVAAKANALRKFAGMSANEIAEMLRPKGENFLKSKEWRELRLRVIAKYGAKCLCCGYVPREETNINIDHIKPRKYFPELALEFDNLQPLCGKCNKAKGNRHQTDYRPVSPS